jgi:two-component sensor histidine kinase
LGDGMNVILTGPRVLLAPRAALALGLAIHELTTNAVKFGALSVAEGHVHVTWSVEPGPETDILLLDWVETDGPPVKGPAEPGFGMTLIERGLKQDMSADIAVEFLPTGVAAKLRAPLPPQGAAPAEADHG